MAVPHQLHPVTTATAFVTVACRDRRPLLATPERKEMLLAVLRDMKRTHPLQMVGYAIMDDHFHWLFTPGKADDIHNIVRTAKQRFAHRLKGTGESAPWQERFRERLVLDQADLQRHLDFIHYNPVLHGLAPEPRRYAWSSFTHYLLRGSYSPDWGATAAPATIAGMREE